MFQFARFPPRSQLTGVTRLFIGPGYPIRRSPAKLARQLTEAYRSRATSFFGLQCLGIHRAPLIAFHHSVTVTTRPPKEAGEAWVGSLRSLSYSLVNVLPGLPPGSPAQTGAWAGESIGKAGLVEPGGLEPPTSALQRRRSPS